LTKTMTSAPIHPNTPQLGSLRETEKADQAHPLRHAVATAIGCAL
jgi:hypothetical protein